MIKSIWVAHVLIVMHRHHKKYGQQSYNNFFYQKVSCITKFMEGDQHDAYISML